MVLIQTGLRFEAQGARRYSRDVSQARQETFNLATSVGSAVEIARRAVQTRFYQKFGREMTSVARGADQTRTSIDQVTDTMLRTELGIRSARASFTQFRKTLNPSEVNKYGAEISRLDHTLLATNRTLRSFNQSVTERSFDTKTIDRFSVGLNRLLGQISNTQSSLRSSFRTDEAQAYISTLDGVIQSLRTVAVETAEVRETRGASFATQNIAQAGRDFGFATPGQSNVLQRVAANLRQGIRGVNEEFRNSILFGRDATSVIQGYDAQLQKLDDAVLPYSAALRNAQSNLSALVNGTSLLRSSLDGQINRAELLARLGDAEAQRELASLREQRNILDSNVRLREREVVIAQENQRIAFARTDQERARITALKEQVELSREFVAVGRRARGALFERLGITPERLAFFSNFRRTVTSGLGNIAGSVRTIGRSFQRPLFGAIGQEVEGGLRRADRAIENFRERLEDGLGAELRQRVSSNLERLSSRVTSRINRLGDFIDNRLTATTGSRFDPRVRSGSGGFRNIADNSFARAPDLGQLRGLLDRLEGALNFTGRSGFARQLLKEFNPVRDRLTGLTNQARGFFNLLATDRSRAFQRLNVAVGSAQTRFRALGLTVNDIADRGVQRLIQGIQRIGPTAIRAAGVATKSLARISVRTVVQGVQNVGTSLNDFSNNLRGPTGILSAFLPVEEQIIRIDKRLRELTDTVAGPNSLLKIAEAEFKAAEASSLAAINELNSQLKEITAREQRRNDFLYERIAVQDEIRAQAEAAIELGREELQQEKDSLEIRLSVLRAEQLIARQARETFEAEFQERVGFSFRDASNLNRRRRDAPADAPLMLSRESAFAANEASRLADEFNEIISNIGRAERAILPFTQQIQTSTAELNKLTAEQNSIIREADAETARVQSRIDRRNRRFVTRTQAIEAGVEAQKESIAGERQRLDLVRAQTREITTQADVEKIRLNLRRGELVGRIETAGDPDSFLGNLGETFRTANVSGAAGGLVNTIQNIGRSGEASAEKVQQFSQSLAQASEEVSNLASEAGVAGANVLDGAANVLSEHGNNVASALNEGRPEIDAYLQSLNRQLIGTSPPPEGPLSTIDIGAREIGRTWSENFAQGIGGTRDLIAEAARETYQELATDAEQAANSVLGAFSDLEMRANFRITVFEDVIVSVGNATDTALDVTARGIVKVANVTTSGLRSVAESTPNLIKGTINGIFSILDVTTLGAARIFTTFGRLLNTSFAALATFIIKGLGTAFDVVFPLVVSKLQPIGEAIISPFRNAFRTVAGLIVELAQTVDSGITAIINGVLTSTGRIGRIVTGAIEAVPRTIGNIFTSIVDVVRVPLTNVATFLRDAAVEAFTGSKRVVAAGDAYRKLKGDAEEVPPVLEMVQDAQKETSVGSVMLSGNLQILERGFFAIQTAGTNVFHTLSTVSSILSLINPNLAQLGIGLVAIVGAGLRAATFQGIVDGFKQTGVSLQELRDAAGDTVKDIALLTQANIALAGSTGEVRQEFAEKLPALLEIARGQARRTGQSVQFLFESISSGIKRSSPLLIDNTGLVIKIGAANEAYAESLGKTVSQLTPAETQIALLNATLEAGAPVIEGLATSVEGASEKIGRATARLGNIVDRLAFSLRAPFASLLDGVNVILGGIESGVTFISASLFSLIEISLSSAGIIGNAFSGQARSIFSAVGNVINAATGRVATSTNNSFENIAKGGQTLLFGFIGVIGTFAGLLVGAFDDATSAITGFLNGLSRILIGASPPPEGPLKDIDEGAKAIGEAWSDGLATGITGVENDINEALDNTVRLLSDTSDLGFTPFVEFTGGVQERFQSASNALRRVFADLGTKSIASIDARLRVLDTALFPFNAQLQLAEASLQRISGAADLARDSIERQIERNLQNVLDGDAEAAELVRSLDRRHDILTDRRDSQQAVVDEARIQLALAEGQQAEERTLLMLQRSILEESQGANSELANAISRASREARERAGSGSEIEDVAGEFEDIIDFNTPGSFFPDVSELIRGGLGAFTSAFNLARGGQAGEALAGFGTEDIPPGILNLEEQILGGLIGTDESRADVVRRRQGIFGGLITTIETSLSGIPRAIEDLLSGDTFNRIKLSVDRFISVATDGAVPNIDTLLVQASTFFQETLFGLTTILDQVLATFSIDFSLTRLLGLQTPANVAIPTFDDLGFDTGDASDFSSAAEESDFFAGVRTFFQDLPGEVLRIADETITSVSLGLDSLVQIITGDEDDTFGGLLTDALAAVIGLRRKISEFLLDEDSIINTASEGIGLNGLIRFVTSGQESNLGEFLVAAGTFFRDEVLGLGGVRGILPIINSIATVFGIDDLIRFDDGSRPNNPAAGVPEDPAAPGGIFAGIRTALSGIKTFFDDTLPTILTPVGFSIDGLLTFISDGVVTNVEGLKDALIKLWHGEDGSAPEGSIVGEINKVLSPTGLIGNLAEVVMGGLIRFSTGTTDTLAGSIESARTAVTEWWDGGVKQSINDRLKELTVTLGLSDIITIDTEGGLIDGLQRSDFFDTTAVGAGITSPGGEVIEVGKERGSLGFEIARFLLATLPDYVTNLVEQIPQVTTLDGLFNVLLGRNVMEAEGEGSAVGDVLAGIGDFFTIRIPAAILAGFTFLGGDYEGKQTNVVDAAIEGLEAPTEESTAGTDLINSIGNFFTIQIPAAILTGFTFLGGDYEGKATNIFEAVLEGLDTDPESSTAGTDLISGIVSFFTETIPNAITGAIQDFQNAIRFGTTDADVIEDALSGMTSEGVAFPAPEPSFINGIRVFFTESIIQPIAGVIDDIAASLGFAGTDGATLTETIEGLITGEHGVLTAIGNLFTRIKSGDEFTLFDGLLTAIFGDGTVLGGIITDIETRLTDLPMTIETALSGLGGIFDALGLTPIFDSIAKILTGDEQATFSTLGARIAIKIGTIRRNFDTAFTNLTTGETQSFDGFLQDLFGDPTITLGGIIQGIVDTVTRIPETLRNAINLVFSGESLAEDIGVFVAGVGVVSTGTANPFTGLSGGLLGAFDEAINGENGLLAKIRTTTDIIRAITSLIGEGDSTGITTLANDFRDDVVAEFERVRPDLEAAATSLYNSIRDGLLGISAEERALIDSDILGQGLSEADFANNNLFTSAFIFGENLIKSIVEGDFEQARNTITTELVDPIALKIEEVFQGIFDELSLRIPALFLQIEFALNDLFEGTPLDFFRSEEDVQKEIEAVQKEIGDSLRFALESPTDDAGRGFLLEALFETYGIDEDSPEYQEALAQLQADGVRVGYGIRQDFNNAVDMGFRQATNAELAQQAVGNFDPADFKFFQPPNLNEVAREIGTDTGQQFLLSLLDGFLGVSTVTAADLEDDAPSSPIGQGFFAGDTFGGSSSFIASVLPEPPGTDPNFDSLLQAHRVAYVAYGVGAGQFLRRSIVDGFHSAFVAPDEATDTLLGSGQIPGIPDEPAFFGQGLEGIDRLFGSGRVPGIPDEPFSVTPPGQTTDRLFGSGRIPGIPDDAPATVPSPEPVGFFDFTSLIPVLPSDISMAVGAARIAYQTFGTSVGGFLSLSVRLGIADGLFGEGATDVAFGSGQVPGVPLDVQAASLLPSPPQTDESIKITIAAAISQYRAFGTSAGAFVSDAMVLGFSQGVLTSSATDVVFGSGQIPGVPADTQASTVNDLLPRPPQTDAVVKNVIKRSISAYEEFGVTSGGFIAGAIEVGFAQGVLAFSATDVLFGSGQIPGVPLDVQGSPVNDLLSRPPQTDEAIKTTISTAISQYSAFGTSAGTFVSDAMVLGFAQGVIAASATDLVFGSGEIPGVPPDTQKSAVNDLLPRPPQTDEGLAEILSRSYAAYLQFGLSAGEYVAGAVRFGFGQGFISPGDATDLAFGSGQTPGVPQDVATTPVNSLLPIPPKTVAGVETILSDLGADWRFFGRSAGSFLKREISTGFENALLSESETDILFGSGLIPGLPLVLESPFTALESGGGAAAGGALGGIPREVVGAVVESILGTPEEVTTETADYIKTTYNPAFTSGIRSGFASSFEATQFIDDAVDAAEATSGGGAGAGGAGSGSALQFAIINSLLPSPPSTPGDTKELITIAIEEYQLFGTNVRTLLEEAILFGFTTGGDVLQAAATDDAFGSGSIPGVPTEFQSQELSQYGSIGSGIAGEVLGGIAAGLLDEEGLLKINNALASGIGQYIIGASPPPLGPLSNIDEDGKQIGNLWVSSLSEPLSAFAEGTGEEGDVSSLSYFLSIIVTKFAEMPTSISLALSPLANVFWQSIGYPFVLVINTVIDRFNIFAIQIRSVLDNIANTGVDVPEIGNIRLTRVSLEPPDFTPVELPEAQRGGAFGAGAVLVGERGPEVVAPATRFNVFPNSVLREVNSLKDRMYERPVYSNATTNNYDQRNTSTDLSVRNQITVRNTNEAMRLERSMHQAQVLRFVR